MDFFIIFIFFLRVYGPQGYRGRLENRNAVGLGFAAQFHKALMASQEPLVQVEDHHSRPWAASLHHRFSVSIASLPKHTCMHVHAHPLFRNFTIVFETEKRKKK